MKKYLIYAVEIRDDKNSRSPLDRAWRPIGAFCASESMAKLEIAGMRTRHAEYKHLQKREYRVAVYQRIAELEWQG